MNKANSDPNQRTAVWVKSPACRCGELIGLPRNDSTLTLGTRNLWFSLQQLFWAMHENVSRVCALWPGRVSLAHTLQINELLSWRMTEYKPRHGA